MAKTLVTSNGAVIQIGRELGKGGEGSVFEVPNLANQVAKIYHQAPDLKKQAKLAFMAGAVDQVLLNYVAWPQDTLHSSRGGPVVGFLMPKVTGRDPVHMVYSPAHRRQDRPKAAWDFLLFVARNTAAAFDALHSHGHVLGDVNQGNVMVGGDSKVVLIDSDSFQVNAKGSLHLCEVGVAHFTPPELQGISSFSGTTRTANHDNFGLALLIFHLLFGGRHPYSGVPLKSGVGDALETDIKAFRYAYGRDAAGRGISPPPRSIPLSMIPDSMESMFQLAFTERGAQGGRPTAKQWEAALDALRGRLKKCSATPMHVYPDHLSKCPWCALEQQGVVYFIDLGTTFTATASGFNLVQVWAQIEAVPAPAQVSVPAVNTTGLTPKPLPEEAIASAGTTFWRLVIVLAAIFSIGAAPGGWFVILGIAWALWSMTSDDSASKKQQELNKRRGDLTSAQEALNNLLARAKLEAGPEGFHKLKEELKALRDEYQRLPQLEANELEKLKSTAQQRQKEKFLERFFIDSADIPGVGPTRKAALRSFGIETAADVSKNRVLQVKGFGDSLTRAMTDWKASIERRFVFNPATAVSDADKNAVKARFAAKQVAIANKLKSGPGELQRFKLKAAAQVASLQPQLEQAAKRLAQVQADLTVF